MNSPKTVTTECVMGELVFAETIKFRVSANVWRHQDNWGGNVTFNAFVAVEPGDRARLRILRKGEFPVEMVSVVRHDGGETTVTFAGAGAAPGSARREPAGSGVRVAG